MDGWSVMLWSVHQVSSSKARLSPCLFLLVAVFCKMSSNNGSKMARAKRGEQFQK
jgi:hypothetical protein